MPQGKRKTPFSGKAKKEQLKAKKQSKSQAEEQTSSRKGFLVQKLDDDNDFSSITQRVNYQSSKGGRAHVNKYALHFHRETEVEIRERKELARQSLQHVQEEALEISIEDYFLKELSFPQRPPWSFSESLESLDAKENKYFTEYLNNIEKQFNWRDLSYFELNLETWRQLWRVLEMSDIILFIVDIRFPALMFPPSLYDYVTQNLKKDMILIMNKIDLAPAELVAAWKIYFKEKFPKLHVLMFTTLPGYNLVKNISGKEGLQVRRRKGKLRMAAEGTQLLFNACKEIVGDNVDLSSWQEKIKEEISQEYDDNENVEVETVIEVKKHDTGYFKHEKYINGILTIGCIGQPNVGKSSLMNAVKGKKVVSVSKTPGHTKHFQTIFVTNNVRFCDCPGLVFPSKVPKPLQVLMGSFPIAQLREPYTTIKYLAERLDLPKLLHIDHPEGETEWSAMDICDGWAKKRGFITAKAARLDTYRAANNILRMTLDGKICLCLRPPEFALKKNYWINHPEVETVQWIQACSVDDVITHAHAEHIESSEDEDVDRSVDSEDVDSQTESDDMEPIMSLATNKFDLLKNEQ